MSDPKPIRVESCRPDGRCPECGNLPHLNSRGVALRLPCGCEAEYPVAKTQALISEIREFLA